MRLPIRWKLLVLLLALALIPLGVVAFIGQRSARRLGTDFATQTGDLLAQSAAQHLQAIVDHAARTMFRTRQLVELALTMQATQVNARLAHRPPEGARVYFDTDFDDPASRPPGMVPSLRHAALTDDGRRRPLLVSMDHQVVRLAPGVIPGVSIPGVSEAQVATDIARLSDMALAYGQLHRDHDDLIYWQYTGLESGVHTAYPGKGGYPADYDPRTRPWYVNTKTADGVTWAPPTRDALTGNVMLTCAMPVTRADGSFAGVTAIDVSMGELLRRIDLPRDWEREARSMFVAAEPQLSPDAPLVLVDQDDDASVDRDWHRALEVKPLSADETGDTRAVLSDMVAGKANVRTIRAGGRRYYCAYGPVADTRTFFMVTVPHDLITEAAARVHQQMLLRTLGQLRVTGVIAGLAVVVTVIAGLLASRHFTRPVHRLADAAGRIAGGDLDARVTIHTADELQQLGDAFNEMVPKLRDRMRMRQSLALAMEVQQCLLPQQPPQVPGLDIAGHSLYCDETGGDYYDFLTVEEFSPNVVGVAVGDVTGHGVAAALLMTTARALIRTHTEDPEPLARIITRVNRHLSIDRLPGRFMTLFCCILDTKSRRVRWTSAGHDPAIVYHPGEDRFSELSGQDLPLGIDPAWTYHEDTREGWTPGEVIVIGTDGVWECRNAEGVQFGKDRLREVIRTRAGDSAAEISRAISDAVHAYRGDLPQEDDITLVVLKTL